MAGPTSGAGSMMAFFTKLFGNVTTWLVLAVIVIAAGCYVSGYLGGRASVNAQAMKDQIAAQALQIQKERDARAAADAVVSDLRARAAVVDVRTETIIRRIPVLVKDNRSCDLSPEALQLDNQAWMHP